MAVEVPEGITVYGAYEPTAGKISLDRFSGSVLAAETPVVLSGDEGVYTFTVSNSEGTSPARNILSGTILPETVEADSYYALGNFDGFGFYLSSVTTIPAKKAYLLASYIPSSEPSAAKSYLLGLEDVTAIDDVEVEEDEKVYYDLAGRKVLKPTKGVYIVNGKKILVK